MRTGLDAIVEGPFQVNRNWKIRNWFMRIYTKIDGFQSIIIVVSGRWWFIESIRTSFKIV